MLPYGRQTKMAQKLIYWEKSMSKTLVIVLSETRAHELTFESFKKNVIDEIHADLCLCIGVKPDYDYTNPFYTLAKYKFLYDEPDDFGDAFDYAYTLLSATKPKYECLKDTNALYDKLTCKQSTENITYYGEDPINLQNCDDDEIVVHGKDFPNEMWRNQVYGNKIRFDTTVNEKHVNTYRKALHWREFLKIKDQFMGGIKDPHHQHPGSAGILIFFRFFLLKNMVENDLINKYDRFIITRSDFVYQLPHPKVTYMNENVVWIPNGEQYNGYTDRHAVLSKKNIEAYLNILHHFVLKSNEYFIKMSKKMNGILNKLFNFIYNKTMFM